VLKIDQYMPEPTQYMMTFDTFLAEIFSEKELTLHL